MKIALISDIHGNLHALKAVVADIEKQKVDQVICLGDVATLGPNPVQVTGLLKDLNCPCIMGNHDEALLFPKRALQLNIAEPLLSTLEWNRQQLSNGHIRFFQNFQNTLTLPVGDGRKACFYHGSFTSNIENLLPDSDEALLQKSIPPGIEPLAMAGGHTHRPMVRWCSDVLFVNPGSVGCAFAATPQPGEEPRLLPEAQYAILKFNDGSVSAELKSLKFDLMGYRVCLRQSNLPLKEWWLRQY